MLGNKIRGAVYLCNRYFYLNYVTLDVPVGSIVPSVYNGLRDIPS